MRRSARKREKYTHQPIHPHTHTPTVSLPFGARIDSVSVLLAASSSYNWLSLLSHSLSSSLLSLSIDLRSTAFDAFFHPVIDIAPTDPIHCHPLATIYTKQTSLSVRLSIRPSIHSASIRTRMHSPTNPSIMLLLSSNLPSILPSIPPSFFSAFFSFFLPSFLPFFLSFSFLPHFIPSALPSLLPSILPFFLPFLFSS